MEIHVNEPVFTTGPVTGEILITKRDQHINGIELQLIGLIKGFDYVDSKVRCEFEDEYSERLMSSEKPCLGRNGEIWIRKKFKSINALINLTPTLPDRPAFLFTISFDELLPASLVSKATARVSVEYFLEAKVNYSMGYYADLLKNISMSSSKKRPLEVVFLPPYPAPPVIKNNWKQVDVGIWHEESKRFGQRVKSLLGKDTAAQWFKLDFEAQLPDKIEVSTSKSLQIQSILGLHVSPAEKKDHYPDLELIYLKVNLLSKVAIPCAKPIVSCHVNDVGTLNKVSFKFSGQQTTDLSSLLYGFVLPVDEVEKLFPTQSFPLLEVYHEVFISMKVKVIPEDNTKQRAASVQFKIPIILEKTS